jgi:hypothetical protein
MILAHLVPDRGERGLGSDVETAAASHISSS